MYPIPDKIEIKADGNMISSSVRIVPASLNHAATVKATDIYGEGVITYTSCVCRKGYVEIF